MLKSRSYTLPVLGACWEKGEEMKRVSEECLSKVDELIESLADNIKRDITENKINYEDEMPYKVMALAKLMSARAKWN